MSAVKIDDRDPVIQYTDPSDWVASANNSDGISLFSRIVGATVQIQFEGTLSLPTITYGLIYYLDRYLRNSTWKYQIQFNSFLGIQRRRRTSLSFQRHFNIHFRSLSTVILPASYTSFWPTHPPYHKHGRLLLA